jgi:hypothetical protein
MTEYTPQEVSDQAAEAIRKLNHMTLGGAGLEYPGDLYTVVANLSTMAMRLPQLLSQLGQWLEREHEAGRVDHDSGGNVAVSVATAQAELATADAAAGQLQLALDRAHNALGHLKAAG